MKRMTEDDWKGIEHFSPREKFGDSLQMSFYFMKTLDKFRDFLDLVYPCKMVITAGWSDTGHTSNSQHYKGKAVDGYLVKDGKRVSLLQTYLLLTKFYRGGLHIPKFTGIGLYKVNSIAGKHYIHIDGRQQQSLKGIATWAGLSEEIYETSYLAKSIYYPNWDKFHRSNGIVYVPLDNKFFRIVNNLEGC